MDRGKQVVRSRPSDCGGAGPHHPYVGDTGISRPGGDGDAVWTSQAAHCETGGVECGYVDSRLRVGQVDSASYRTGDKFIRGRGTYPQISLLIHTYGAVIHRGARGWC